MKKLLGLTGAHAKLAVVSCPSCRRRKPRRVCPALGQTICSVCCGTKRLTEIQCPSDCVHLATAREHPAAVVRRQQEHDIALVLPAVNTLSRLQFELFFLLHGVIARHQPGELSGLVDDDVADAAGAIAATYETAARGVLYDHEAESVAARRLAAELKETLAAVVTRGGPGVERQVAPVLRAIERGARELRHTAEGGGRAYLLTMGRLVRDSMASTQAEAAAPSPLIIP